MTELRLLGWKAVGFRCPDHEISLTRADGEPHHVSLIQMPNGTGKTTTLKLLRAALSGPEAWNDARLVPTFAPRGSKGGKGVFDLRLRVDGKRFTITMTLDFAKQECGFRTSWNSSSARFVRPAGLLQVLTADFVPFFVLDGELAHDLLDERQTKARQALEVQFQLSTLKSIGHLMDKHWEEKVAKSSVKGDKGLKQRQNRLASLEAHKASLDAERAVLAKSRTKISAEREALLATYRIRFDEGQGAQEERARLEAEIARNEANVAALRDVVMGEVRRPQNLSPRFVAALQTVRENLEILRLPANAAREFFEELARAKLCVCGDVMTEARRNAVLAGSEQYLGKEDMGVLNAMKTSIKTLAGDAPHSYRAGLDDRLARLRDAVRDRDLAKGELAALEQRRLGDGDAELAAMKTKLTAMENDLADAERRLEELDAEDDGAQDDDTRSRKALRRLIALARDLVAEATETRDVRIRTSIMRKLIDKAVRDATEGIARQLVSATNDRLVTILKRSPLRVADVRDNVVLDGQASGSPGQTLALGYAFLLGLFDAGQLDLPFVVDSPTGALDKNVRREVAAMMPKISSQLVAFTTSSEYDEFVPVLHSTARGDVKYMTMFRLNEDTQPLIKGLRSTQLVCTANGAMVTSKPFFESFDSEAVEAETDERVPPRRRASR